jgi:hypothetical protein
MAWRSPPLSAAAALDPSAPRGAKASEAVSACREDRARQAWEHHGRPTTSSPATTFLGGTIRRVALKPLVRIDGGRSVRPESCLFPNGTPSISHRNRVHFPTERRPFWSVFYSDRDYQGFLRPFPHEAIPRSTRHRVGGLIIVMVVDGRRESGGLGDLIEELECDYGLRRAASGTGRFLMKCWFRGLRVKGGRSRAVSGRVSPGGRNNQNGGPSGCHQRLRGPPLHLAV